MRNYVYRETSRNLYKIPSFFKSNIFPFLSYPGSTFHYIVRINDSRVGTYNKVNVENLRYFVAYFAVAPAGLVTKG